MTVQAPPPAPAAPPTAVPAPSAKPKSGGVLSVLCLLLILVLAGGEGYLWHLIQGQTADATELAVLRAQLSDLQAQAARAQPAANSVSVQADLGEKLATLAAQLNAVQTQGAADHGALTSLQVNAQDLTQLTQRITKLNALETARIALAAGQPLGDIPGAPPALAKYADLAPPTEAVLRLGFPDAARAANAASVSTEGKDDYWTRVIARLESFITISDGTHVLVGPPAAGVLAQAQSLLEAGDLAGAVAKIDTLSTPTKAAMGPWLTQAHALLAARAALASMAGQS